jgi:hypothetical protein
MIVDTGGVNLLTAEAAARLGLARAGSIAGSGAGEAKVDVGITRARELAIGAVRFTDPTFYIFDLSLLIAAEGEALDGVIGFELFHRLAVRIDYPARALTVTRPDAFTPPPRGIAVPFELHERIPLVAGTLDGIPARFTIDTGAGDSLTVSGPFARAKGLEARFHATFETVTGGGVGGFTRGKPVRIPHISLGAAAVTDIAGELFTGDQGFFASEASAGNVGGRVLARFAVSFDYRARTLYLEPAATPPPRDIYDRSGFGFLGVGGALRVFGVAPGGPAQRAGIAVDDRVVAIDGAPITSRSLAAWRALLQRGEVGARHELIVETGGARRGVALVLAELVP